MYHSLSFWWVHILGSFHQVGESFVTWCLCYVGRCTIHYPYYESTFLGHSTRLGASFVTWCPCYVGIDVPFIILIMSADSQLFFWLEWNQSLCLIGNYNCNQSFCTPRNNTQNASKDTVDQWKSQIEGNYNQNELKTQTENKNRNKNL